MRQLLSVSPALLMALLLLLPSLAAAVPSQETDEPARIDYLTLAQGALPLPLDEAATQLRVSTSDALQTIDGNPGGFTLMSLASSESVLEIVYVLPAPTAFDRFAVPSVLETPSPSQTFVRQVELHGSDQGPDGPWELLATGTLTTHAARGEVTDLELVAHTEVRWVKLRLNDGIEMLRDPMFLEFSEIIGNGTQRALTRSDGFAGYWEARGVRLWLQQEGSTVSGCYDEDAELAGTVSGNILRARGSDPDTGVESLFVLVLDTDGQMHGVRSTNGAPFHLYEAPPTDGEPRLSCVAIPPPALGCGSIIHAINFDYDSARIRTESEPVLDELFAGLRAAPEGASIVIEGHTSSEGSTDYNLGLSERRAQSVVDALVSRGLDAGRISALGVGESGPIASNDDEAGRSLNRRVEVRCTE